jgi:phosphatidylglycerol---prolipoprotein diacylglyceryl transferase
MIPYWEWHVIHLGPVTIQVWGLFVALGILAAAAVGAREAERLGLERGRFLDLASVMLLGALVGARVFHAAAYAPGAFLADPFALFRVWEGGMSMVGGLLGGALGAWWQARRMKLDLWAYVNVVAFTVPLGCAIGRLGCFFIHDHPGTLAHGLLSVRYPGGDRLDHGLLLSLWGAAVFALFLVLRRAAGRHTVPMYLQLYLFAEGLGRFLLDFLRATDLPGADARYLGLTPAQYAGLAMIAIALKMRYTDRIWNSFSNATKTS